MSEFLKVVKMINGEDIVFSTTGHNDDLGFWPAKNPTTISIVPSPDGQTAALSLRPTMVFAKNQAVEIYDASIAIITNPEDNLANRYTELFSSIKLVPSMPKGLITDF